MRPEEMAALGGDLDDFSASATLIPFDDPIPLLRGPVPAGASDDPAAGPFVLAFRDVASWRSAYRATESKIVEQCEAGARIGCSISASHKCKPPWWKNLLGISKTDFAEREQCEEQEMASCLEAAKQSCIQFATDKCFPAFSDARIVSNESKTSEIESETMHQTGLASSEHNLQVTNYRASVLQEKPSMESLY